MSERDNERKRTSSYSQSQSRRSSYDRSYNSSGKRTAAPERPRSEDWREMVQRQDREARRERARIEEERESGGTKEKKSLRDLLDIFDEWYDNVGNDWGNKIRARLGWK